MCTADEPISNTLTGARIVGGLLVLDERSVAAYAESFPAPSPQFAKDEEQPLVGHAAGVSTHVDESGLGHIAVCGSTPWSAIHQVAHLLTGRSWPRLWLAVYKDLVDERYGLWDSILFDYAAALRVAYKDFEGLGK